MPINFRDAQRHLWAAEALQKSACADEAVGGGSCSRRAARPSAGQPECSTWARGGSRHEGATSEAGGHAATHVFFVSRRGRGGMRPAGPEHKTESVERVLDCRFPRLQGLRKQDSNGMCCRNACSLHRLIKWPTGKSA